MKKFFAAALLLAPFVFQPTFAATAQQQKMAACNKDAADKKGDERKAFMKECLSSKPKVSDAQKAQQEKMKSCNAEAKDMKGADRKKFMSECLKKSG
ncbi:PsiF family protein [Noviherbaspirillum sp. UKPF54]|uniref:PsiF family protein n=1 Tax=Noviherbaspirillum sp. UKPF54 TaxID=2601898 RepID=UPI0011B13FA1|nr:PsiF family protein [Noviherbaspirillum sp. UKPF54]QDZ29686.1 phosphate starvation-inducible protein PsiF [Noviherbaspirillum sp. UKPF54]